MMEPKLRASEIFIKQGSVSEDKNNLAIDMDNKRYAIPEVSAIIDFIQPINVKEGRLESKFGIGVSRTFGKDLSFTTARIKDSSDFKVRNAEYKETKLILETGVTTQLSLHNRMPFNCYVYEILLNLKDKKHNKKHLFLVSKVLFSVRNEIKNLRSIMLSRFLYN